MEGMPEAIEDNLDVSSIPESAPINTRRRRRRQERKDREQLLRLREERTREWVTHCGSDLDPASAPAGTADAATIAIITPSTSEHLHAQEKRDLSPDSQARARARSRAITIHVTETEKHGVEQQQEVQGLRRTNKCLEREVDALQRTNQRSEGRMQLVMAVVGASALAAASFVVVRKG